MRTDCAIYTAFEDFQIIDSAKAEKALMKAILRTAIEDLSKRGEPYRQARKYLLSSDDYYLFSFLNICSHLHICPRKIRMKLGLLAGEFRPEQRLAA